MNYKFRPKLVTRILSKGGAVKAQSAFAIEICVNGKWTLVGDDGGPFYFKTASTRDKKMETLRKQEIST